MTVRPIVTLSVLCVAVTSFCAAAHCAEWSVREFNAKKARWRNYAAIKRRITLEGRVATLTRTGFRLRNCEIPFETASGKSLPELPKRTRTVTVVGYLTRSDRRYEFHLTEVRARPSDVVLFHRKKRDLPLGKPQGWYDLANWANRRATFYKDAELRKLGLEANLTGIRLEKNRLSRDRGVGLLKLAAKAKTLAIPDSIAQQWIFEAHRLRWIAHRTNGDPSFNELVKPLPEDLPGCTTPLKSPDKKLAAAYAKDPLGTYRKAAPAQLAELHRLFYIDIQLREIEKSAATDGSNGLSIAGQIGNLVPERAELARKYREIGEAYRLEHAGDLSRAEAIALAGEYRERKDPQKAKEVLKKWLKSRIAKRRSAGVVGLLLLADDYERLLGDKQTAYAFVSEAYRKNPKAGGITERMTRLGYTLRNGRWVAAAEAGPIPAAGKPRKEGVAVDMTQQQVRAVMFGAPDSVTRVATRRVVHEVWVYGTRAQSRLAIHFERPHHVPRDQAKVVNVTRTAAPRRGRR